MTPLSIFLMPSSDDRTYAVQPSSIAYLVRNNFDFAKPFNQGVGWLTVEQQAKREQAVMERAGNGEDRKDDIVVTNEKDKEFCRNLVSLVTLPPTTPGPGIVLLETPDYAIPDKYTTFHILKPVNRYLRRVAYETLARESPNTVCVTLSDERLAIKTLASAEHVALFKAEQTAEQLAQIKRAAGARQILDLVAESGVPVVGHNTLLDVLHVLRMCSSNVTGNLDQFKALTMTHFPGGIVDTKYVAKNLFPKEQFGFTGLEELSDVLRPHMPQVEVEGEEGKEQFHDACYDALQTGRVFLGLANLRKLEWRAVCEAAVWQLPLNASDVTLSINKAEPEPDFSNVLLATDFPAQWKQADLGVALQGKAKRFVWLSDCACAAAFENAAVAEEVLSDHIGPFGLRSWAQRTEEQVRPGTKRQRQQEREEPAKPQKRGLLGLGVWIF